MVNKTKKYEEWEFLAERVHHRLEQERITHRKGYKISLYFLKKIAMRMGLDLLKEMSYDEVVKWLQRHGL
ncbi:hypothetical protein DRO56_02275 [Candidatus Bathyarchaeota archaeon]|nr:MAG: hypothetical protein CW700_07780 [Candidatus Bathyarchaeota archaeon]RLI33197.1 MAG: hypothetical protein DRO56_02275 [Candidatus Bathyarchaeota archaeon]